MRTEPAVAAAWRRARRGQAMLEYTLISHFLLLGGGALMLGVFGSDNGLVAALGKFYDSVFFIIESAAI